MGRPRIGITTRTIVDDDRSLTGSSVEYAQAIAHAGGMPLQLPGRLELDEIEVLEAVDGLVLTGGGDVDPLLYGEEPSRKVGGMDHARDEWELELTQLAVVEALPLLAICRGCQILNVAQGGTLIQDLGEVTPLNHLVLSPRDALSHEVLIEPGSQLAEIVWSEDLGVNSIHHQAVSSLGNGLEVGARSVDGIIESIELDDAPALGVQWHPEHLGGRRRHEQLFSWLVDQASRHRSDADHPTAANAFGGAHRG
jgi:putative glutamine amidotransferase